MPISRSVVLRDIAFATPRIATQIREGEVRGIQHAREIDLTGPQLRGGRVVNTGVIRWFFKEDLFFRVGDLWISISLYHCWRKSSDRTVLVRTTFGDRETYASIRHDMINPAVGAQASG